MYPLVKKLLIADDHPLIRRALHMLIANELKITDIKEVATYNELLEQLKKENYSHLILDLILSDVNSASEFSQLRKDYPGLAILIYSMHSEEIYGPHLRKLGARCYLNKQSSDEEVIRCLKEFFTGKKCNYIPGTGKPDEMKMMDENPFSVLSQRELEVLQYLLQGNSVKEISSSLNLGATTVATFKTRIFEKLKVRNILELNQLANLYHAGFYR